MLSVLSSSSSASPSGSLSPSASSLTRRRQGGSISSMASSGIMLPSRLRYSNQPFRQLAPRGVLRELLQLASSLTSGALNRYGQRTLRETESGRHLQMVKIFRFFISADTERRPQRPLKVAAANVKDFKPRTTLRHCRQGTSHVRTNAVASKFRIQGSDAWANLFERLCASSLDGWPNQVWREVPSKALQRA